MWFRKKIKKKNPEHPTYQIRPTDMVGHTHYVLEWFDVEHDEWVYSRTVSLKDLRVFVTSRPTSYSYA